MPPGGWFIDADVLGLYHVLHAARRSSTDDVVSGLTADFPVTPGMPDVDWMPIVSGRDLGIITKDGRQRFREAERQAIIDNELGVFALRSRQHMSTWQQARLVFDKWEGLEERWSETTPPFVYTLSRGGGFKRML